MKWWKWTKQNSIIQKQCKNTKLRVKALIRNPTIVEGQNSCQIS